MANIDLSIIILSYNTRELLKKCLNSLKANGKWQIDNMEVIVVDNNSTDGSIEMLNDSGFRIQDLKIIENKENLGFAKGNNVGLTMAKGRYILFLNSDTEVYPKSLAKAIFFMESHPEVSALTAKTLLASGKMDPDCHRGFPTPWASITYFLGLEKLLPKTKLFGQYHKRYLNLNENHEIEAGAGAFMLISRKVIEKVGAWDESYFFYGEDLDFFYRIKQAGFKVYFFAEPLLTHYKGASSGLRKESKNMANNSRENRIRVAKASIEAMEIFYKKFYKKQYPWWLTSSVLTAIRVKGFFRVLKHAM